MKYDDAVDLMYKTKWKTKTCLQGVKCWCRMVVPAKPIFTESDSGLLQEIYISGPGELNKRAAEYFVKLHNQNLSDRKEKA